MSNLREEAEKQMDDYIDMGCFRYPEIARPYLINGYELGCKSRDKEIKKLQIQVKHLTESLNESYKHYR